MTRRRLVLAREALTTLAPDQMSSVVGAISRANPLCETNLQCELTSLQWSYCADTTCGIACTADCQTG